MRRHALTLIPAICIVIAITANAFGQIKKYTESFDKDRQDDPKIVETLRHLNTADSKLDTKDLLKKLNEWGATHRAQFKLEKDVIVMKVFWDHEDVESRPQDLRETEGTNHCLGVADAIISEWNKDRSFRLVRFVGVELIAFPLDQKEGKQQNDGSRKMEVVASPEVHILLE